MFLSVSMIPQIKKNALSGRCFHRRFPVGTAFFHSSEKADCQNDFPTVGSLRLICRYGKTKRSGLSQACFDGFVEIPAKALSAITGKSSPAAVFLVVPDLCPPPTGTILYGRGKKQDVKNRHGLRRKASGRRPLSRG